MGGAEAPRLFGREHERALLLAMLEAVSAGNKRALALVGDPGIGKTSLLHLARALADDAGFVTAGVRAPAVAGIPHSPVRQLLERIRGACARMKVDVPATLHAALETMSGRGSGEAGTLMALAIEALERIAARRPVALFVDDFHRAPSTGTETLVGILRAVDAPVGLVMSAHRAGAHPSSLPAPGADLWVDLHVVGGLAPEAIADLARARLGGAVLPSMLELLVERCAANPLFLLEELRDWEDAGALVDVGGFIGIRPGVLPLSSRSLGSLMASRAAGLSEAAIGVAQVLAALGREATFDALVMTTGMEPDALAASIAHAVSAGVLAEDAGPPVGYRLAHPIYEQVLLSGRSMTERGLVHQRVFAGLLRRRQHGHEVSCAEIASHALLALEQPADLDALIVAAAREAEDARSLTEAAAWWSRAAARAAAAGRAADRARALARQAAATVGFDARAAVELYDEALEAADDPQARRPLLAGRARAHRIAGAIRAAVQDLSEALPGSTGEERIQIRNEIARLNGVLGRRDVAEGLLHALARDAAGSGPAWVRVMADLASVRYAQGRVHEAAALLARASEEADDEAVLHLEGNATWVRMLLGDWDGAARMSASLVARADRAGDLWSVGLPLGVGARIHAWRGDVALALDEASRAVRVAELLGSPAELVDALEVLALVLLEAGKPAEAASAAARLHLVFEAGIESRPDHACTFVVAGEALLEAGDSVRARALAAVARGLVGDTPWGVAVDRLEAEVALRLRDRPGAYARLEPWLRTPSIFTFEQARAREVAARALFLMGERREGAARADEALETYEQLGVRGRRERFERVVAKHRPKKVGRPRSSLPGGLTARETEVLGLVLQGLSNRQIAEVLVVSPLTAKKHIENIFSKAGVRRRAHLLEFAVREGIDVGLSGLDLR